MNSKELAVAAVKALDSKKGIDLKMIGIKDISVLADYFVLATGTSNTHVKALADEAEFALKEQGHPASHSEGYRSNSWILLDFDNVIVHVFTNEARKFYDLDHLWQDGVPEDITALISE